MKLFLTLMDSDSSIIDQKAQRVHLSFLNEAEGNSICAEEHRLQTDEAADAETFPLIMRQESGEGKHQHNPERCSTASQVSLQGIASGGWTQ